MPVTFKTLDAMLDHGFDTVIDVRSPAEFAADHVPGAINLPALSNAERAEVGTIYKQVSPFDGRKIGAAMVIRNLANHLDGPLSEKDGSWRPLVYCWRGGQRSGVFAGLLGEVGWRAETVKGGYQTYRRLVNTALYDQPLAHRLILLDGNTGTAKTELLHRLAARGVQMIDLEGLARHRGSLLGAQPGGQPAQKAFETAIANALRGMTPDLPVLIEAESSKIGRLVIPPSLWVAMLQAPRIVLDVPQAARAQYLATAYHDVIADPNIVATRLAPLRRLRGHRVVDRWVALSQQGELVDLSYALMQDHYDPAYEKSRRIDDRDIIARIAANTLDDDAQEKAADQILTILKAL
ncbi:tRNA 2-selenouridine(34) synthase MnmH [Yoonia sp. SS1-5]|uniref:tRNA 2-selenouridine(34) synthase MnmH n=1 Tax=Yoonia rhodophyticola TaxID=3137370 RepID=A0AAN0NK13_9RHOB